MKNLFNKVKVSVQAVLDKINLALITLALLPTQAVFADNIISGDIMSNTTGDTGIGNGIGQAFGRLENVATQIVQGLSGVLAIVMVGCFAWKAFTLSRVGDNPAERAKTIQGMIFFFIGAAAFGAAYFFVGLFVNILR